MTPHATTFSSEPATGDAAPGAGAPKIEVTPAMIEAGVAALAYAYRGHGEPDDFEDIATAVYSAMRLCCHNPE